MDQALKFEEDVAVSRLTLFFECPHEVMLERLLKRGETSGRTDDNIESIKKRFRVFEETSMPVVNYFDKAGKVVKISCVSKPNVVYDQVKASLHERGIDA
jgi:UMP-CMP kinase